MDIVLEVSTPVFGLGLLGYFATKLGWFSRQSADGLANFVYHFAVPLLLFRTLANAAPSDAHGGDAWRLALGYYAPMAVFYFAGALISRFAFKQDFNAQIITGFCCSYGNAILLGLPLALLTFGDAGAIPFFILLALHALCAFTVTTIALEYGASHGVHQGNRGANRGGARLARMA
ncbi:MAG: AEC family transporter, partial [bacterium]